MNQNSLRTMVSRGRHFKLSQTATPDVRYAPNTPDYFITPPTIIPQPNEYIDAHSKDTTPKRKVGWMHLANVEQLPESDTSTLNAATITDSNELVQPPLTPELQTITDTAIDTRRYSALGVPIEEVSIDILPCRRIVMYGEDLSGNICAVETVFRS